MVGGVALSIHPITAGMKLLLPLVCDRLSRLENYSSQLAGSLQALLEDIKMLLPIWMEEEWCEVNPGNNMEDVPKTLSGSTPALLVPPPLAKKESTPLTTRVLPKVTYEIQPQAQKPDFDPEGWLLV